MTLLLPQVVPETSADKTTPPAADPSLASDPSGDSLDSTDPSLAAGSPSRAVPPAPVSSLTPATVSPPAPEPNLAPGSPTPAPAAQNDSEDSLGAQNDTPPAQTTTVPSDDPPAHVFEPLAMAVYSEPAATPSISALESTGDPGDSQTIPSTSGASKKVPRKAPTKKVPNGKKATAK